ncbi:prolyl oligopeptidase family serine peptidase [Nocardia asteroides]|uniref:prolyl oligopeptidase family serine peptidase n=1 Tax=Nocardia asteroides TaxID=1824 RepID=UPI001E3DF915|nr:prolyl oligopeptidase family serine peptidase [Nocardia asteroides]UGT58135.1 prolyl oligopeptidase family serine peptidase [Nocardia asteroides]
MSGVEQNVTDPYLWLEDVTAEAALDWARARNDVVRRRFAATDRFTDLERRILAMLDDDTKIAFPGRRGQWLYNFWRDAAHPRGLWRRTTFESYATDDPEWDVLIDVDALAEADGENWVWAGATVLRPSQERAFIQLSRGGADAKVQREFDLTTRQFIDPADGGFFLPEAKSQLRWIDIDTVYVGTDFGPDSLTDSGYPRVAKRWHRGTPLAEAVAVFEGKPSDVSISVGYDRHPGFERHWAGRATDFFNEEVSLLGADGSWQLLDTPTDADVSWYRDWLLVRLKTEWTPGQTTFAPGSLLVTDINDFLAGGREFEVLFAPDPHTSLESWGWTENHLILTTLRDVQTGLRVLTPGPDGWTSSELADSPAMSSTSVNNLDPLEGGDEFMLTTTGFTTPTTLLSSAIGEQATILKQAPGYFDAEGIEAEQYFATSDDGTAVPYFVIRHRDRRGTPGPTIVDGYGGFEISRTPAYLGAAGMAWLEKGGTFVMANIRGGGEYGPEWHTAALKEHRHRAFEDFAAVARDLVDRGITTPDRLGAKGGSNGGLLMGVMLTRYPELFGAIVCQVPLLDMRRYHLLLAGASWVAEYGDPDKPEEWAYISEYSPYQNTDPARQYPPILLATSTRDDRVHPGHARKMAALLESENRTVWYYENIEGGHGGAADNKQAAHLSALVYEFFTQMLMEGRRSA